MVSRKSLYAGHSLKSYIFTTHGTARVMEEFNKNQTKYLSEHNRLSDKNKQKLTSNINIDTWQ